jgi:hypothetical protein
MQENTQPQSRRLSALAWGVLIPRWEAPDSGVMAIPEERQVWRWQLARREPVSSLGSLVVEAEKRPLTPTPLNIQGGDSGEKPQAAIEEDLDGPWRFHLARWAKGQKTQTSRLFGAGYCGQESRLPGGNLALSEVLSLGENSPSFLVTTT